MLKGWILYGWWIPTSSDGLRLTQKHTHHALMLTCCSDVHYHWWHDAKGDCRRHLQKDQSQQSAQPLKLIGDRWKSTWEISLTSPGHTAVTTLMPQMKLGSLWPAGRVVVLDRKTGWRRHMRGGGPGTRSCRWVADTGVVFLHIKGGCRGFTGQTLHRALKLLVGTGALKTKPLRASQWQQEHLKKALDRKLMPLGHWPDQPWASGLSKMQNCWETQRSMWHRWSYCMWTNTSKSCHDGQDWPLSHPVTLVAY